MSASSFAPSSRPIRQARDVIPGGEGARKVRWAAGGRGKRGGARIIYFNLADEGAVYLVMIYAKPAKADATVREIKHAKH